MEIARSRLRGGSHFETERERKRGHSRNKTERNDGGMEWHGTRESIVTSADLSPLLDFVSSDGTTASENWILPMCRCAPRDSSHVDFCDSHAEDARGRFGTPRIHFEYSWREKERGRERESGYGCRVVLRFDEPSQGIYACIRTYRPSDRSRLVLWCPRRFKILLARSAVFPRDDADNAGRSARGGDWRSGIGIGKGFGGVRDKADTPASFERLRPRFPECHGVGEDPRPLEIKHISPASSTKSSVPSNRRAILGVLRKSRSRAPITVCAVDCSTTFFLTKLPLALKTILQEVSITRPPTAGAFNLAEAGCKTVRVLSPCNVSRGVRCRTVIQCGILSAAQDDPAVSRCAGREFVISEICHRPACNCPRLRRPITYPAVAHKSRPNQSVTETLAGAATDNYLFLMRARDIITCMSHVCASHRRKSDASFAGAIRRGDSVPLFIKSRIPDDNSDAFNGFTSRFNCRLFTARETEWNGARFSAFSPHRAPLSQLSISAGGRFFAARSGMSVGSGGRAPFKRTTQNIQPPRKSSRSQ
ncbi:hypothetical protein DBV15_06088 [Temnothorax longispinosus]|uniref:Uncharacterized protein n=1 Tax=Temnothorax longispinosus TaxID=300112 RepID=A0A4V3SA08_9HYME|nr:hypothetical protein DBV15_06088 [Temnothorax longispinosus]